MNAISRKVLEFQQRRLTTATNKLQYHTGRLYDLRDNSSHMVDAIRYEESMVTIWKQNVIKIQNEIQKIQSRD